MNNEVLRPYFFIALLLGSFVLACYIFSPFFIPLALAAVCAVVLQPLYTKIERTTALPGWAAALTIIICVIGVLAPLWFLSTLVVSQAQQLFVSLSAGSGKWYLFNAVQHVQSLYHTFFPRSNVPNLYGSIDAYARVAAGWLANHLGAIASSVASLFVSFFIFLFALFYFLCDGKKFKKALIEISPLQSSDDELILSRLELAVTSIIRGNLVTALIQGALTGIGFGIFGVPNSILWGVVGGVASLIPGIGASLVILPGSLFLYLTGNPLQALGLGALGFMAVGMVDNVLKPRLVGRGAKLHPLMVLLSVLGGLSLFGAAGIFLGPIFISLLFAIVAIQVRLNQE